MIFHTAAANCIIAVILFVIGYLAKKKSVFVVFRPFNCVVMSIQNTFNLLKLKYTQEYDMFIVDKTGTKIKILKVGFFSTILFYFVEKNSQKEQYIVETLVKYQH